MCAYSPSRSAALACFLTSAGSISSETTYATYPPSRSTRAAAIASDAVAIDPPLWIDPVSSASDFFGSLSSDESADIESGAGNEDDPRRRRPDPSSPGDAFSSSPSSSSSSSSAS